MLGLVEQYRNDGSIQRSIRQLMALGCLPAQVILGTFKTLKDSASPTLASLFEYYEHFWLERVGVDKFSVFEQRIRTNNNVESWHSGFNKLVRKRHPNIYEFVENLRKEQENTEQLILQLTMGERVSRRNLKYERLSTIIDRLTDRYKSQALSDVEFLNAVGYQLCKAALFSKRGGVASD